MSSYLNKVIGASGKRTTEPESAPIRRLLYTGARAIALLLLQVLWLGISQAQPVLLLNIKNSDSAPWESQAATQSIRQLADSGARGGMLVAFAWQADIHSSHVQVGSGSEDWRLRLALNQMRATGMETVLKLHVWVPSAWAGDINPDGPVARASWFADYTRWVVDLAQLAQHEHVQALVIGTELRALQDDPHWPVLIREVRQHYVGKILYAADSIEQAERFPYWSLLDAIGINLYPALPENDDERRQRMKELTLRIAKLSRRLHKPVWVTELGIRSASGSLERPWESPEERVAKTDLQLQKNVLTEWLQTLEAVKPSIHAIAIWCWYTDPDAGGLADSDFTIQNKPAQYILDSKKIMHRRY